MNADCFYEIGYSHSVCEDYALAGKINNDIYYALVCDGCSASNNVDVGARLIAHSTINKIKDINWEFILKEELSFNFITELCLSIAIQADMLRQQLKLPISCLDTTLVLAISNSDNMGKVFVFGDGGAAIKDLNGKLTYRYVHYQSGAPYYLSYLLDHDRNRSYFVNFGHKNLEVITENIRHEEENTKYDKKIIEPYETQGLKTFQNTCFSFKNAKFIGVMSDGIHTYEKEGNEAVDHTCMIEDFMNFKNTKGQFVIRRTNRIRKECISDNIKHYDDVSVSAIFCL